LRHNLFNINQKLIVKSFDHPSQGEIVMADSQPKRHDKIERLKHDKALNPHPEKVRDAHFLESPLGFFDPHDLLQVKYEMLRSVEKDGHSVTEAARNFGVSRACFYHTRAAFEQNGLAGLLRGQPGPKSARKLTEEIMEFIDQSVPEGEPLRARGLALTIKDRFGIDVHPRSIERAVKRRKKKASSRAGGPTRKRRKQRIRFG
jgi:transposase